MRLTLADWMQLLGGDHKMRGHNMCVYYLIPIVIHLLFLPFWFLDKNGTLSLAEMFICTVAIPIYLIIVSGKFLGDFSTCRFLLMLLVMLAVTLFGIAMFYFNWGISTANLFTPDSETVLIMQMQIIVSSAIVIVGWAIVCFIKNRFK